jgi:hypothetical protein
MYKIPTLGLNIGQGLLVLILVALIILIVGHYNIQYSQNEKIAKIREQVKELSISNTFIFYYYLFIHYFVSIFGIFCIFIFNSDEYIMYVWYLILFLYVTTNIIFLKNECILSYLEKYLLDNTYIFNSNKKYEIYKVIILGNYKFSLFYFIYFILFVIIMRLFEYIYSCNCRVNS